MEHHDEHEHHDHLLHNEQKSWVVEKRVSLSVIALLVTQAFGFAWGLSALYKSVEYNSKVSAELSSTLKQIQLEGRREMGSLAERLHAAEKDIATMRAIQEFIKREQKK